MIRRWFSVLSLLLLPSSVFASEWAQFGLTSARGRASDEISGTDFTPAWTFTMDGGTKIVSSPAVSDGTLIAASRSGQVVALTARDGTMIWQRAIDGGVGASPAIGGGQVFVPSLAGRLSALRLRDGSVKWDRALGGQNYGSPALITDRAGHPDSVVVAAGFPGQSLLRVKASDGSSLWETTPGAIAGLVYSSAAQVGNHVLIGMNGGRYQSFDLTSGATDWQYDASGGVNLSSPLVQGQRAYLLPGDHSPHLYAVDVETGAASSGYPMAIPDPAGPPKGTLVAQNTSIASPMAVQGLIVLQIRFEYLATGVTPLPTWTLREYVVGIDGVGAKILWSHPVGALETTNSNEIPELGMCPTPAGFSGDTQSFVVAASSLEARIRVLSAATGDERWSAALSKPTRSSPILANGLLYVATDAGVIHAFRSTWNTAPRPPQALTVSADAADEARPILGWTGGTDPEEAALTYEVRVDDTTASTGSADENADPMSGTTASGQCALEAPGPLSVGHRYTFIVRSRDPDGALSEWSQGQDIDMAAVSAEQAPPQGMAPTSAKDEQEAPPAAGDVTPSGTAQPVGAAPSPSPAAPTSSIMLAVTTLPMSPVLSAAASMGSASQTEGASGCSISAGEGHGASCTVALAFTLLALASRKRSAMVHGRRAIDSPVT